MSGEGECRIIVSIHGMLNIDTPLTAIDVTPEAIKHAARNIPSRCWSVKKCVNDQKIFSKID